LKQLLIGIIDGIYIRTLQHHHTGYANITTHQQIKHLLHTDGNITPPDLADNNVHFKTPYDPVEPIETLFLQVEDTMDYANASSNAYTTNQVVSNAYNLIFNTGMVPEACRNWCKPGQISKQITLKPIRISDCPKAPCAGITMDSFVTNTADAFSKPQPWHLIGNSWPILQQPTWPY
jgi:hypothetical protein